MSNLNKQEQIFDEHLDTNELDVVICGLNYSPSTTLKTIDPIAYKELMSEFFDNIMTDFIQENDLKYLIEVDDKIIVNRECELTRIDSECYECLFFDSEDNQVEIFIDKDLIDLVKEYVKIYKEEV